MCEDRVLRIKKGTHLTRARAARRLLRIARAVTPPTPPPSAIHRPEDADTTRSSPAFRYNPDERTCSHNGGCRRREGLLDIALRTVALMRRNKQLQIRLAALQAETTAFIKSVMNNPENRRRHAPEPASDSSGPSSLSSESTQDSNSAADENIFKQETTDVKPME